MRCMPSNEVYAANEPNFLGPISYGTQQIEPQFLMGPNILPQFFVAYIRTSGPVLYVVANPVVVRGMLDRKISEEHLQSSNASIKKGTVTQSKTGRPGGSVGNLESF